MTDYLILGGGLSGCVVASRLKQYLPQASVTVVEWGPNEHDNPLITEPMGTFKLHMSPLQHNYKTVPQRHLDDRQIFNAGGKQLSGSSAVNYAAWTRGDASDYDLWAKTVGDDRWSYKSQLPFMKRTEAHHDRKADPEVHGFDGPIWSTSATRNYPLAQPMHEAFVGAGFEPIADANDGHPRGIAAWTENWRAGKRQPAGKAYKLEGVDVMTSTAVNRILIDQNGRTPKAVGVELDDGHTIMAKKEVILSCGTLRSPQILMTSGIGPAAELKRLGVHQVVDLPVGENLFDHITVSQCFKVKHPANGVAAGSPAFNDPSYVEGIPIDWYISGNVPTEVLEAALRKDGLDPVGHPLITPTRTHFELAPMYAAAVCFSTCLKTPD